jgi:predicted helicase
MEHQSVTTDKSSQITNKANHYTHQTKQNAHYALDLLTRIITVSFETMRVVDGLPGT